MKYLFFTVVLVLGFLYCVAQSIDSITETYKPIVQIINVDSGTQDEIPYQDWLDISNSDTEFPTYHTYIRHITWNKCRKIEGVIVQTFKDVNPGVTIYYKDVCK